MIAIDTSWRNLDILFSWIGFLVILVFYLPIIVIVYYTAENRGESGFMWVLVCVFLPGVGLLFYIAWTLILRFGNVKSKTTKLSGFETPDMELSRQRLRGGGEFIGKSYEEIELHVTLKEWDDAENLIASILEEAERSQDGPTIADMIAYKERVKKGRRG